MISVVLSILILAMWLINLYLAYRNDYYIAIIAVYSACTGLAYYMMCLSISEYLFKQI
jgi:hypothetical protein